MGLEDDLSARVSELEAEVRVLSAMLENAPDFISRITVDGNFLYLNHVSPGLRVEDVLGTSVYRYIPEAFYERAHAAMRAARETRSVQQYATLGPRSADSVGHYLTRVGPVVENDEVTSLVMIATDLTSLEEQRVHLQVALDAGGLGIWTYNPKQGQVVWDVQTKRIFGVPEDTPPPTIEDILSRHVHAEDRERVQKALDEAGPTGRYGPLQHRIVHDDGKVRWVNASGLAIRDHEGRTLSLVGSVQDCTERRLLEERLLEAQKLESIGRLAGGVAHDFNNMLTAIFGNLQFALEVDSLAEARTLIEAALVAAERSAALTAQLLAFARRQVIEPKLLDPNDLIRRLETMFRRGIGEQIQIVLSLTARGRVRAGESQLEQVVMNLLTNARDAMASGGVLTIETVDVTLDEDYANTQADVRPGPYVLLAVSDTGPGIPPDALPHLFEPFFSTRPGGTGLGLATCYGIVKQSGGHLSVDSALGQGTTFKVYLPRVDAEATSEGRSAGTAVRSRSERVLLVEDEEPVRMVVEKILGLHGYHVSSAPTAEAALRIAGSEPPFALLVSDVVLPGMSGRALADRLAPRFPGLRVLFISGYTENAIVHNGTLDPGVHFLQKPFLPATLLEAVQRVLDAPAPDRSDAR
jgi:PAS domain S-box-containing protein